MIEYVCDERFRTSTPACLSSFGTETSDLMGKTFRISGFGYADSIQKNNTSKFGLQITATYSNGTSESAFIPFTSDTGNWQFTGGTYTVENKAVRSIDISCVYAYQGGTAYFDDIIVAVENEATTTVNSYYPETGLPHYTKSGSSVVWYEYNDDRDLTRQITNDGMAVYQYDDNHNVTRMDYYTYGGTLKYTASTYSGTGIGTPVLKYETSHTYNAYGLPTATSTVSADGTITSSTTYDTGSSSRTFGAVLTETDSLGRVTRYFYDAKNGDLKAVINPDETGLVYTYDNLGNLELVEPAMYDSSSYSSGSYDSDTSSASATYTYNSLNQLQKIQTESTTYNFTYDTFGNSKSVKVGTSTLASYTYNNYNGKMASMTYGNGTKVEYVYDELDRVAEVWYTENGGSKTKAYSYEYDANGNLYRFNDHASKRIHVYKYDLNGNMLMAVEYAEDDFYNKFSTDITYDTENRPTYVYYGFDYADPTGGNDATFIYDYSYNDDSTLNKLLIKQNSSTVVTITPTYDALSRVTTQTNKVGSATNTINYQFKANGSNTSARISQMTSTVGSTTTTYKYTYDENGNITEIANASGVIQNKYWYDDLGQLVREDNRAIGRTYLFNYDNAGNIQYRKTYAFTTAGTATSVSTTLYSTDNYTYGNANWGDLLTAYKGTAISYDTIGNPINYYNGYEFTWAKGRQLASATNGTNNLSFTYNADGIRTSKTVNGVKHTYLLSGSTIMAEYWQQSGIQHVLIYLYDITGAPVGMMYRTNAYAADTYDYFLFEKNLQGDIVAVYNASGTKLLSYTYDAWGNCTVTGSTTTGAQYNPFRYRGYFYDSEIGLYYLNSRYYDSNTGRFINADTNILVNGTDVRGHNLFVYCFNNPINMTDESGYWPSWATKLIIGTAVIAVAAALTVATAGTGTALACFAIGALKGAAVGAAMGAASGAATGAIGHRITTGSWDGSGQAALEGAADGYMSGAITGFVSGGLTSNVCFVAGTSVLTSAGNVAIENIRVKDYVWATNPETGETELKQVVQTFVKESSELVHLTTSEETITATPTHPFYVPKKGWTSAIDLRAGDILVTVDGEYVILQKVQHEILESPVTVYNFEVDEFHTYHVGEQNLLVHNLCTKNNYRHKALEYYDTDGVGLDAHHIFPQSSEFSQQFANAGINPHSPWNIRMLDHNLHIKNSATYNKLWRQFFADNPNASRSAIEHAAGFFMDFAFGG